MYVDAEISEKGKIKDIDALKGKDEIFHGPNINSFSEFAKILKIMLENNKN